MSALVALLPAPGAASWIWTPRTQVSHTVAPDSGAFVEQHSRPGRGSGVLLHAVARIWDGDANFDGRGYYLRVHEDSTWAAVWASRELITNTEPTTQGHHRSSTDHHIEEDRNGDIHLVSEVAWWPVGPYMGYKRRSGPSWNGDSLATIINPAGATSPNLFLQETASGDTLHLTYHTGFPSGNPYMAYRRKRVSTADDPWDAESVVTHRFGSGPMVVDAGGVVHFFGTQIETSTVITTTRWHLFGTYPGAGETWSLGERVLASWTTPLSSIEAETPPDEGTVLLTGGPYLYSTFAAPSAAGPQEMFLRRLDLSDSTRTWDPSIVQITPGDGVPSRGGIFFATGEPATTYHLMYQEPQGMTDLFPWDPDPPDSDPATRLYHRYATGDPMIASSWSVPTEVVPERRTVATRPQLVARGDSAWVTWVSYDDDDPTPGSDSDWEIWARDGHALADTLESANVTLAGAVFMDSDFEVQSGKTLTIAPGTTVYLLASPEPDLVDILVNGALVAVGTETEPITFVAYRPATGASTWGSIVFAPGADGSGSRLEHVVIRDATAGIRCAGTAPSLRDVTFEGNTLAEIVLEGDTRIETGSEWILDAPLRVMALETPASEDTLGTDGYTDLIVPGLLETASSASPDSVWFTSFSKDAVNGDDWAGITVPSGGRGLLRNCDIGYALRGVYFADADSAVLVDSRVHHYSEEGVFAYGGRAFIQGCTIDRGVEDEEVRTTGIRSNFAVPQIVDNDVGWQTDYGVWIRFGNWVCAQQPWGLTDTLRVVDNRITGDGATDRLASAGIRAEFVCLDYRAEIEGNTVSNWRGRGLDLYEVADVHLICNGLEGNYAGAQYTRKNVLQAFEEDVFWRGNSLRQNASDNLKILYETGLRFHDDAGSGAAAGENTLQKHGLGSAKSIRIAGGSFEPVVDARHQTWLDASGTAITDSVTIQATNVTGPAEIKVGSPLTADESCAGGGSTPQPGGRSVAVDTAHGRTATSSLTAGVPTRWSLAASGSNPTSETVSWVLAAPIPSTVRLAVYDVRGRLVRRLGGRPVAAGYHEWRWDRSAEDGGTVASGVYFLRVESPQFRHTRKVVLLPSGR